MCDEDSLRREPKIILQRAEYIFPALKNSLVSIFVFVRIEQKAIIVYSQKIIFGNILPLNISPHFFSIIA
jgi:hypothetical protein